MEIRVIAIDPSIISMGIAYLEWPADAEQPILRKYLGLCEPDDIQKQTTAERIKFCTARVRQVLKRTFEADTRIHKSTAKFYGVIELPQNWGAYKSVASQHSGALPLLRILVGALFWELSNWTKDGTFLVPVSTWKGQLKKHHTMMRMERKYNVKFPTDDESDAVGIGDWFLTKGLEKYKLV